MEIIDFETDRGRNAEAEYRTQLSIYHHVVAAASPDRVVESSLFYTADGTRVEQDPLERSELKAVLRERSGIYSKRVGFYKPSIGERFQRPS